VAAAFKPGVTDLPPDMVADVLRTDGRARAQLLVPAVRRDQIAVAAGLKQPLAVLHGAQEQLINGDYFGTLTMPTLWRGAVQVIDDAGHIPQWEQPDRFNALLDAFVSETP
jgi:pimeloyl-ACP methyl ester carboxylesterase